MHKLCSLGEISEKPSQKLGNMVITILKTIDNINIVFSNYFQKRYKFSIFSPWTMYWFEKWPLSVSFIKENSYSNDFRTGAFKLHSYYTASVLRLIAVLVYFCPCTDYCIDCTLQWSDLENNQLYR